MRGTFQSYIPLTFVSSDSNLTITSKRTDGEEDVDY